MSLVFRTADLPESERFDVWREATSRAMSAPVITETERPYGFDAALRLDRFGPVQVSTVTTPSLSIRRPWKLVRRSDPEQYGLGFTVRGSGGLEQGGRQARLDPTDLVLYDSSRPLSGWIQAGDRGCHGVVVTLPRSLLPLAPDKVATLAAVPLSGRRPVGRMYRGFLLQLIREADALQAADVARLAPVLIDLVTAVIAGELDAEPDVHSESRRRILLMGVRAFIDEHLREPALTPTVIAAANHISVRYLHQLFRDEGVTVAELVRRQRLERCRRDLSDPALQHRPVAAIGARWGLPDSARFSRAFRAAYGLPPLAYRRQALAQERDRTPDHAESAPWSNNTARISKESGEPRADTC